MNRRTDLIDRIAKYLYDNMTKTVGTFDGACQITRSKKRKSAGDILDIIKDGGGWP